MGLRRGLRVNYAALAAMQTRAWDCRGPGVGSAVASQSQETTRGDGQRGARTSRRLRRMEPREVLNEEAER